MRARRAALVAGLLIALALVAAVVGLRPGAEVPRGTPKAAPDEPAAANLAARFSRYTAAREPNGDLSKVVWPRFVTLAGPDVKRLYEFQITNGELMRYIPCFCGCSQEDGHRSNRDCYVERVRRDGSVVLDSMAPT